MFRGIAALLGALLLVGLVLWALGLAVNLPEAWRVWHHVRRVERNLADSLRDLPAAGLPDRLSGAFSRLDAWVRSLMARGGPTPKPSGRWLGKPLPSELARLHRPEGVWLEDGVLGLVVVPVARLRSSAQIFPEFRVPAVVLEVRIVRAAPVAEAYEGGPGWRRWVMHEAND